MYTPIIIGSERFLSFRASNKNASELLNKVNTSKPATRNRKPEDARVQYLR